MFTFLTNLTGTAKAYIFVALLIIAVSSSSWVTWQVAQRSMDKERIELAQREVIAEKERAAYYTDVVNTTANNALKALDNNAALDKRVTRALEAHSHAKPLPLDCTIDADGVLLLKDARNAAITAASGSQPTN